MLKKGDRVRLKKDFDPEKHRGIAVGFEFVPQMDKYIGKDFDVDEVEGDYIISDDWAFNPDWLELVERMATGEEAEQAESVFLGDTLLQDTIDIILESGSLWFGKPMDLGENEESILQEAQRIVNGDRQADYSDPVANFEHIARITSAILNKEVTAEECCIVMIAVKHAREQFKHKRDNLVDLAGYVEILNRIKESR